MNNGQKSLSINETFIVESENDGTMSACTGFFTNALVSCTGNTQILLGTNLIEANSAFSATTFYGDGSNLTGISTQDTFVTGGTYSEGTAIFTNNTGGTFNVTGFYTGATDVFVTGGTYFDGVTTFTNNTGGTFTIDGPSNYNSGIIIGGENWVDNGNGSINLPEIKVALFDNPDYIEPLKIYTIASGTTGVGGIPPLVDNDTNYIIVEYNNGLPRYNVLDNDGTVDNSDIVLYMIVYRANNFVHTLEFGNMGAGLPNKLTTRLIATDRFARESGCALGLSGSTGIVTLSSGAVWNGPNRQIVSAVNSQDDVFFKSFHSGGTWVYATTGNTINNDYYDDGTNLILATNGKYLVNWYFRGQEINDHLYELISYGEYDTIQLAEASPEPNLPELITSHAFLVGRIIVGVSATTGITQSAFNTVFQPSGAPVLHNDLAGIQGGLAGQYYHLDSNKYNHLALTNNNNNFSVGQTFNVGLTADTISATTYQNLPLDITVTGGTYSSGTTVFTNNTGGTFSITGFTNPFTGGDYIQFNTGATETIAAGKLYWNDVQGTMNIGLKGGQTNVKSGVDLVVRVVNKVTPNTTLTKAAYQAVRISGAQAQRLAVELAQANNDNNSADTIGLVCETIATNQEGYIMTVGQLENVNTTGSLQGESWSDGDVLYLSPTTAGRLTNIRPSAPNKVVIIGFVEYAHSQNGKIYVRIDAGLSVNDLDDVNTNSVVNGQVLTYEGGLWVNKTPVAGVFTGGTVSGFTNFLSGLDSTSITLSDDNGFSSLNGSYWEMFNNDGYYLNLSNVGLTFNDLFSNTIYNAVGMYISNDTDYSEYLTSKIKQNGIEYFLPTGTTSQIATKADILSSVSGITLNNVATNGNSTGNSLIVTNGIYTTTHSNNGLVASFSGGSSTMNATQISTTNGSSTNTITSIKSSITEGVDTFEVTKSNLSISNSLSGFSVSVNITNGFTYNSTGGVYTNYSLNKITNNGIDYLLPTGTTSQIATKADITLRKRQIVNDTVTSTVSGTTTSTIVKSYQFLPGTLTPSGFLEMYLLSIRTGLSLAHTMNVFINTTNSLSGATLIGGFITPGNFSPVFPMKLFFVLKDNLIVGGLVSQSTMTNLPSSATFVSAPCNNTINAVWILVTITPGSTNQVIGVQGVEIIN